MRQFYLGNNSSGYYRVYFVDPVTGTRGPGKSTHTKSLELLSQKLHKSIIPTLSEEQVETPVEIKNETADPASTKKRYVVIKKKNSEPLGKKSRKQKAAKSFCFAILLKTSGIMISLSLFTATFPEAIRCLRNTHFACMHL